MFAENLKRSFFYQALKGAAIATLLCVLFAALLAAVSRFLTLSAAAVKITGIAAKILSLFFAALLSFKDGKGWLKGLATGILFGLLTCFIFSAAAEAPIGADIVFELLFGAAVGVICGMFVSVAKR